MMDYYVIFVDSQPIYVCNCSKKEADQRKDYLVEEYNRKYNVKSAWKKAALVEVVKVVGDLPPQPSTSKDIIEAEVIEHDKQSD